MLFLIISITGVRMFSKQRFERFVDMRKNLSYNGNKYSEQTFLEGLNVTLVKKYGYILSIILLSSTFTLFFVLKEKQESTIVEVEVVQGDTLWGLAQKHRPNEKPDKWIKEVMNLNNMHSTLIKSGDTLKLPGTIQSTDDNLTELAGE